MPLTNIDYSNTIIYKLCCKDINITDIYIGHTTDMRRRKNCHKSDCENKNKRSYNLNVYQFIRDNGNWDNWDMIEVERYEAIDGYDARKRERYWVQELKATLNSCIPTRTQKEYKENNKEKIKELNKKWLENNKEIIAEKNKEYRKNNLEKIKEKDKKYYENNKEKVSIKKKEYKENNKGKISEKTKEKITCECGCIIRKDGLKEHNKSKKHINLMSQLIKSSMTTLISAGEVETRVI